MPRRKKPSQPWGSPERAAQVADEVAQAAPEAGGNAGFSKDQLRFFLERIERLEQEKKDVADDIKDVFAEAKANGFDVKALRAILKIRNEDADKRAEHLAIVDLYLQAIGYEPPGRSPLFGGEE